MFVRLIERERERIEKEKTDRKRNRDRDRRVAEPLRGPLDPVQASTAFCPRFCPFFPFFSPGYHLGVPVPALGRQQESKDGLIDIDCDDPDVQQAATKIQAAFRGSQARKNIKDMQETSKIGDQSPIEDIDPNDPEANKAAAKIQASFRGHKVRKEMKKQQDDKKDSGPNPSSHQEEEEIDIDLDDPDVQKAATKIQASFRGHLVRKQVTTQDTDEV